jgi:hypothetical protein
MSERGRPPDDGRGEDGRDEMGEPAPQSARDLGLELGPDVAHLLSPLDGAAGPARRLSSARSAAMVSAIVDAAAASAPASSPEPGSPQLSPFEVTRSVIFEPAPEPAPRRMATRGVVVAAVVVVASVSTAAAGVWVALREPPPAEQPSASAPAERQPVRSGRERGPASRGPGEAPAGVAIEHAPEAAPEREDSPPATSGDAEPAMNAEPDSAEPERTRRKRPARTGRSRPRRASEARPEPTASAPESAPDEELAAQPRDLPADRAIVLPADAPVEDIVALANQRRKDKRWREAEILYERAMRDHAGTDAAAIATVASASLHLDHLNDPEGALERFHRALRLRPGGPLAEEARWGLAETHRALGDEAAERAALERFLAAHPRSVNAGRARARLAELGSSR